MRFFGQRIGNGLVPDGADSVEEFERLPFGKVLRIDAVQSRSLAHHRLFFALCHRIGKGIGRPAEWVSDAFKVETKHYHIFEYGSKAVLQLDSIAFDKMDQTAFRTFFEECVQIAYREWRIDPADLADLLIPEGYQELVKR
jgi:hypothetical protein